MSFYSCKIYNIYHYQSKIHYYFYLLKDLHLTAFQIVMLNIFNSIYFLISLDIMVIIVFSYVLFIYIYLCNYLFCFLSPPDSNTFFGTSFNKHLLIPGSLTYVLLKFLFHLYLWKIFSFITLKISYLYSLTPKFPGKRLSCKLKCTSCKYLPSFS